MSSDQEYDYVIVGAGSAGCVIANRLVTRTSARVLLVEAGGPDVRPEIHEEAISNTFALWVPGQETDWGYVTEPQSGMNDREVAIARGKVWGGCSSVNAMLYVRGNRMDYDSWAAAGNEAGPTPTSCRCSGGWRPSPEGSRPTAASTGR